MNFWMYFCGAMMAAISVIVCGFALVCSETTVAVVLGIVVVLGIAMSRLGWVAEFGYEDR